MIDWLRLLCVFGDTKEYEFAGIEYEGDHLSRYINMSLTIMSFLSAANALWWNGTTAALHIRSTGWIEGFSRPFSTNKCFVFTDEMKWKAEGELRILVTFQSISILIFHLSDSVGSFRWYMLCQHIQHNDNAKENM